MVVEALQRRVRDGDLSSRNFILQGPYGCGKTSLTEIVGRAMNCEDRLLSGSPCGECEACEDFNSINHIYYRRRNCGEDGSIDMIRELIAGSYAQSALGSSKVFVLDEVHGLSLAAFDALLERLEKTPDSTIFFLLTTLPEKIPLTVRSRCSVLEVCRLDNETARSYALSICEDRHLLAEAEDEAIELVVRSARGHVRDLVRNLEVVAEAGAITVQRVRRVLRLDYIDRLADYLKLVFEGGDLGAQIRRLDGWHEEAATKATRIQEALFYLACNYEFESPRPDPVLAGIAEEHRVAILDGVRTRAAAASISVKDYWLELIEHWRPTHQSWNDSDLGAAVIRFDMLMNAREAVVTRRAKLDRHSLPVSGEITRRVRVVKPRKAGGIDAAIGLGLSEPYLSRDAARLIWNAGSFLIQEHGLCFNTRITIRHRARGSLSHDVAAKLVGRLTHQLELWLSRRPDRASGPALPWVYVQEVDEEGHLLTTLAACVAEQHQNGAMTWLRQRKAGPDSQHWRAIHMRCTKGEHDEARLRRHTGYLRLLCRGLDTRSSVGGAQFVEQLEIPTTWRRAAGRVSCAQRVRASKSIGESAQLAACNEGCEMLSAFDNQAWSLLDGTWQLEEHARRLLVREEHTREERASVTPIEKLSGQVADQAREEIRVKLRGRWRREARERARHWHEWLPKINRLTTEQATL
ncbi:AAA family ATPase [Lichenihabitans psoromatis]|uniref:AAA family ATPase n=1 Tax=Lichenihabitans psoromatis TaxID=2528642 RepID=UPI001A93B571|nr:AAA family ATPase [Lichenihabitans psoromatis]